MAISRSCRCARIRSGLTDEREGGRDVPGDVEFFWMPFARLPSLFLGDGVSVTPSANPMARHATEVTTCFFWNMAMGNEWFPNYSNVLSQRRKSKHLLPSLVLKWQNIQGPLAEIRGNGVTSLTHDEHTDNVAIANTAAKET